MDNPVKLAGQEENKTKTKMKMKTYHNMNGVRHLYAQTQIT